MSALGQLRRHIKNITRTLERAGEPANIVDAVLARFILAVPAKPRRESTEEFVEHRVKRLPADLRRQVENGDRQAVEVARDYLLEHGSKFGNADRWRVMKLLVMDEGFTEREAITAAKQGVPGYLVKATDLVETYIMDADIVLIHHKGAGVTLTGASDTIRPKDVRVDQAQAIDNNVEPWPIDRVAAVLPRLAYGEVRERGEPWFAELARHELRRR